MKKVALSVLLVCSAFPAMAEGDFSAELLLGVANQELSVDGDSTSGDDVSFGVRGVYSLSENFSVEGAYQSYGEADETYIDEADDTINVKISSTALSLGLKGVLPVSDIVSLSARVGISFWDAELKAVDSSSPGEVDKLDGSGNDLYFGVGAQYQVSAQLFTGLEYTVTKVGLSEGGASEDIDVTNIALSLGYKF